MFERCGFLLGAGDSIIIVIPAYLPEADTYTVSISASDIKFKAGYDNVAELAFEDKEVFRRLANNTQVGLIEYTGEGEEFPSHLTHVAYIEIRRTS